MVQPNLDSLRRYENQLQVWVKESKGLVSKKRYFCEIMIDDAPYARTSVKDSTTNAVFWGEQFDFPGLAEGMHVIKINLFRVSDSKSSSSKKNSKQKITTVGTATYSVEKLMENNNLVESWMPIDIPSGTKSKENNSTIRLKFKLTKTMVLPLEKYKHFADLLTQRYLQICTVFEPYILTGQKEEMGKGLVYFLHNVGKVKDYLTNLAFEKVQQCEDENEEQLLFRNNSIATKSVESYMKLVGRKYLHEALKQPINEICQHPDNTSNDWEVDPTRILNANPSQINSNQNRLEQMTQRFFNSIVESVNAFPSELRQLYAGWKQKCHELNVPHLHHRLVCSTLFLRLICPAILNPSLFELRNDLPSEKASRALTLIAKCIHNLANNQKFGNKEHYMEFMNKFITANNGKMDMFLNRISSAEDSYSHSSSGFDGYIDPGKELARLQQILLGIVVKSPAKSELTKSLYPLVQILEDLDDSIKDINYRVYVIK